MLFSWWYALVLWLSKTQPEMACCCSSSREPVGGDFALNPAHLALVHPMPSLRSYTSPGHARDVGHVKGLVWICFGAVHVLLKGYRDIVPDTQCDTVSADGQLQSLSWPDWYSDRSMSIGHMLASAAGCCRMCELHRSSVAGRLVDVMCAVVTLQLAEDIASTLTRCKDQQLPQPSRPMAEEALATCLQQMLKGSTLSLVLARKPG